MSLARNLLLAAIRGYKRRVSPHKGFACAYRVHEGCASCSTLGLRAISRHGAWRGLGVLRLRLHECHLVAQEFRARPAFLRASQAGFIDCDVPCDGSCVDASACEACDALSCLDCDDCGCGDWLSSRRTGEAAVRRRQRRRGDPPAGPLPEPAPVDEAPSAD